MRHIAWELGYRSHALGRLSKKSQAAMLAVVDRLIVHFERCEGLEHDGMLPNPGGDAKVFRLFPLEA